MKRLFLTAMITSVSLLTWAQHRQLLHEGWTFGQARLSNRYSAVVPGLQPVTPQWQLEPTTGGYFITLKADRFVRALCLSVDDKESHLDNNYFDLLPSVPVRCFLQTSLSAEDVRKSLSMQSLNQMSGQIPSDH